MVLTQAVLLALLPVLCCFVRCVLDGGTISEVWLPAGRWNNELFYYKQVEGIVGFGYPQGYFGYNESHALKLSFASGSPVVLFPWVIWGRIFGWNLWSPIVCNIVLMSVSCFLFVWLAKPTWKQFGVLALLFSLYTPFTRYMLSGMTEVIFFSMMILFYALAASYLNNRKVFKLVLLFLLAVIMTLMRPYLLLFLFLPAYLWVRRSSWQGVFGSAAVMGVTLSIYACIRHYLGAEYFMPPFFAEWTDGGFRTCITGLHYMGRNFLGDLIEGFRSGLPTGACFGGYVILLCVLAGQSILDRRRFRALGRAAADSIVRDEEEVAVRRNLYGRLVMQIHLALSFGIMFFILLLVYDPEEGSRHLLTFMTAGILVIALMDTRHFKKAVLVGITFFYLYSYMAVDPLYYELPYRQEESAKQYSEWEEIFDESMELETDSDVPDFDNTVIWVFQDEDSDGSLKLINWELLYALPKGFGISCCMPEYVIDNFGGLESKYIATLSDGRIDGMCADAGYREIGRDRDMVIYRLR